MKGSLHVAEAALLQESIDTDSAALACSEAPRGPTRAARLQGPSGHPRKSVAGLLPAGWEYRIYS